MTKFVKVARKDIEATALVPAQSLAHYKKAGWEVAGVGGAMSTNMPDGDPSAEWTRAELDAYAAARLSVDTTSEKNKADVLSVIQAIDAAQPDNNTETPATGADTEES